MTLILASKDEIVTSSIEEDPVANMVPREASAGEVSQVEPSRHSGKSLCFDEHDQCQKLSDRPIPRDGLHIPSLVKLSGWALVLPATICYHISRVLHLFAVSHIQFIAKQN